MNKIVMYTGLAIFFLEIFIGFSFSFAYLLSYVELIIPRIDPKILIFAIINIVALVLVIIGVYADE